MMCVYKFNSCYTELLTVFPFSLNIANMLSYSKYIYFVDLYCTNINYFIMAEIYLNLLFSAITIIGYLLNICGKINKHKYMKYLCKCCVVFGAIEIVLKTTILSIYFLE